MVLAVVSYPSDHSALDGHRAGDRQADLQPAVRLERRMREHPVIADGHAVCSHDVEANREPEGQPAQRPPDSSEHQTCHNRAEWDPHEQVERHVFPERSVFNAVAIPSGSFQYGSHGDSSGWFCLTPFGQPEPVTRTQDARARHLAGYAVTQVDNFRRERTSLYK